MSRSYVFGFLACLAVGAGFCAVAVLKGGPAHSPPVSAIPQIVIETSTQEAQILPGKEQTIRVRLHSTFVEPVSIREIRFSHPCASLLSSDSLLFPKVLSPGEAVNISIIVKCTGESPRHIQLVMNAIGDDGMTRLGAGHIGLELLGNINASTQIVTLGSMKRMGPKTSATVQLWYPMGTPPPGLPAIECFDPAISAEIRSHLPRDEFKRVYFAEVVITVNPKIASSRMSEKITLKCGKSEIVLFVLGFVED